MRKIQDDKRFFGKYRGIVKEVDDPKRLGRVRALVPEVFGPDLLTDWAWPVLPYGGLADVGLFLVPEIDSGVFIEFESGNVDRPLWCGAWWSEPGGKAETPAHARGAAPSGGASEPAQTADYATVQAPADAYAARYPHNKVLRSRSGIVVELDDSPSKERVRIFHPSGTLREIAPDGTLRELVKGRRFVTVEAGDVLQVKGDGHVVIEGDATLRVAGDYTVLIEGNKKETVLGDLEQIVLGEVKRQAMGEESAELGAGLNESIAGNVQRQVAGNADLKVLGLLSTDALAGIAENTAGAHTRTAGTLIKDTAPQIHHN